MELGNLAAVAPRNLQPLQRHLESIKKLAESSVNVARNMSLLLRPSMLDDFGLVPALEWQAREVSKRTGIAVSVEAEGSPMIFRTTTIPASTASFRRRSTIARATPQRTRLGSACDRMTTGSCSRSRMTAGDLMRGAYAAWAWLAWRSV
jgi:hypothetical protein